jgi:hypothetical protein
MSYWLSANRGQEQYFFDLLKESLDAGIVTGSMLPEQMQMNHERHDPLEGIERTPARAGG